MAIAAITTFDGPDHDGNFNCGILLYDCLQLLFVLDIYEHNIVNTILDEMQDPLIVKDLEDCYKNLHGPHDEKYTIDLIMPFLTEFLHVLLQTSVEAAQKKEGKRVVWAKRRRFIVHGL